MGPSPPGIFSGRNSQVGMAAVGLFVVGATILAMDTVELELEVPQLKPVTQKEVALAAHAVEASGEAVHPKEEPSPFLKYVRSPGAFDILEKAREHNAMVNVLGGGCSGDNHVKVFNIGLPRTGTRTVSNVFSYFMGNRSCHQFPEWTWADVQAFQKDPNNESLRASTVEASFAACDHLGDVPTYGLTRALHAKFPTARFVLTIAALDSWLVATEELMSFWAEKLGDEYTSFHSWFYGTPDKNWDKAKWAAAWEAHHTDVLGMLGTHVLVLPTKMPKQEQVDEISRVLGCKIDGQFDFQNFQGSLQEKT